jgi:hypothetical protein
MSLIHGPLRFPLPPPPYCSPCLCAAQVVQGAYVLPTTTNSVWSSVSQGGRVVTVRSSDAGFLAAGGTYVIGVYSATDSSFFVTSTISGSSLTVLLDGVPQVGVAAWCGLGVGSQAPIATPPHEWAFPMC